MSTPPDRQADSSALHAIPTTAAPLHPTAAPVEGAMQRQPGPALAAPTADGIQVPGYEIQGELGRGGMGVVYLATNVRMKRPEVLKVVNKSLFDANPGMAERFLREIQAAARLDHENVVKAYSAPEAGGLLVFAMEYVEGEDPAKLVRRQGPLPVVHACHYVSQAAMGLQHAHEMQMVHRDIKPHNLILTRRGKKHLVKVLDFGLAKAVRGEDTVTYLTAAGAMLGTPAFMAPEQAQDAASADIRADIYSLGCTLYYLLTGAPPFAGNSYFALMKAHESAEAPSGKFLMGSPEGEQERGKDEVRHEVELTRPFYLAVNDVTQGQYEALTGQNPSNFKGPDLPVEMVRWTEAGDFARKLTEKAKSGLLYRLPSEAEWEYSCRGGRSSSLPFGIGDGTSLSSREATSREANFDGDYPYGGADKGSYLKETTPVGKYRPNVLGLYDMQGNVWQWCAYYGDDPTEKATTGSSSGLSRVGRGGGWDCYAGSCRAARRRMFAPDVRRNDLGFRLARVPSGLDK